MHIWKQTHENIVHQFFNLIYFVLSLCVVALLKGFHDMIKDTMGTHYTDIISVINSDLSNQKPVELKAGALNSLIQ